MNVKKPYFRGKDLLIICLLMRGFICMGQYDGSILPVSPVTPNAAALFKPEERPLGSCSGTVPVGIPFYTLQCGGIKVPISLSYAMGGVKVEEVASNVGLGWSLTAGGCITRVMNGIPDDATEGLLYETLKPSNFPGDPWIPNVDAILKNHRDMEPDMYYYNFNGNSGKFFFDENGNVILYNPTGIKIQRVVTAVAIIGWVITDLDGTKYYFGTDKTKALQNYDNITTSYASYGSLPGAPTQPGYTSNWHLTEIRDMNEENIVTFTYGNTTAQYSVIGGAYAKLFMLGGTSDCTNADSYTDQLLVTTNVWEHYLTKISTRSEYVSFSATTDRIDYTGASKLNGLSIYDSSGVLKKKYNLNYAYFSAGSGADQYMKRLKLKGVSEFGGTGTDSLAYTFDYYEDVNLPSRISYGVDYWGYYNGQDYNYTFLPNYADSIGIYPIRQCNYADRRANPGYSYANSLRKIHFPTGGYRQFQYEGNVGLLEQGTEIRPDERFMDYPYFGTSSFPWVGWTHASYSHNFTVSSKDGSTTFSYSLMGNSYGNFKIVLTNTGSGRVMNTFNNQWDGTWDLFNGNYRLDFYYDNFSSSFDELDCEWPVSTRGTATTLRYGLNFLKYNMDLGGIRIKEIDDYDHVSGKTYATKYKYTLFSDSTLSSGIQIYPLTVAHYGNCTIRNCQTIQLYPKSCYPMASEGGSYVYYPEVTTYMDGGGYIQREYSFDFDGTGEVDISEYPMLPPADNSWARGKLMVERTFDKSKAMVKKTLHAYSFIGSSETTSFPDPPPSLGGLLQYQIAWKVRGYYSGGTLVAGCYNSYIIQNNFTAPGYVVDSLFSPTGNQVTRTENYYFTDIGYPILKQQKIYVNNGKTREVNYRYAFNNDSLFRFGLSSAEKGMKTSLLGLGYMLPLETSSTFTPSGGSPSLIEGTKYSASTFNGTKIHIASVKHFTSASDSVTQSCTQYDTNGNLCEEYKFGYARTVYLWGYNNSLLVAKIVGSDYNTCKGLVNMNVLQSPSSDQALRDEVNKIRVGLTGSDAQVTTYTFSRLVGLSSQVDPSGTLTLYEYDNHGRLSLIRDANRNILKKFSYTVVNPQ